MSSLAVYDERQAHLAAALDDLAVVDEEGTRFASPAKSAGTLVGSRGWLRRGCGGAAMAFSLPDYDFNDVPHDESLRWCSSLTPACSSTAPTPQSPGFGPGGKFRAINRGASARGSGSSGSVSKLPLTAWAECRLWRPSGSHRELDRREEERPNSLPPARAPRQALPGQAAAADGPCQAADGKPAAALPGLLSGSSQWAATLAALSAAEGAASQDGSGLSLAQRHDIRQRITGTICVAVPYRSVKVAVEDLPMLRCVEGRTFVEELDRGGPAFKAGVRPGDEVIRVKVGSVQTRDISDGDVLARLEKDPDAAQQHLIIFFMGFAGKFPAEVRVSSDTDTNNNRRVSVRDLTTDHHFAVQDFVDFSNAAHHNSLLIACKSISPFDNLSSSRLREGSSAWKNGRVARTEGDVDQTPTVPLDDKGDDIEQEPSSSRANRSRICRKSMGWSDLEPEGHSEQAPWHLLEVERREAKKLLAEALYMVPCSPKSRGPRARALASSQERGSCKDPLCSQQENGKRLYSQDSDSLHLQDV